MLMSIGGPASSRGGASSLSATATRGSGAELAFSAAAEVDGMRGTELQADTTRRIKARCTATFLAPGRQSVTANCSCGDMT